MSRHKNRENEIFRQNLSRHVQKCPDMSSLSRHVQKYLDMSLQVGPIGGTCFWGGEGGGGPPTPINSLDANTASSLSTRASGILEKAGQEKYLRN